MSHNPEYDTENHLNGTLSPQSEQVLDKPFDAINESAAESPSVSLPTDKQGPAPESPKNENPVSASPAKLEIKSEADKGKVFLLTTTSVMLGQSDECEVALTLDKFASEQHARITREGDEWFLEDNGSLNGTYLRIQGKVKLEDQIEVLVGTTRLLFTKRENSIEP